MKPDERLYQHWLEQRRAECPGPELADRVMVAVTGAAIIPRASLWRLALMWIDRSQLRRLAACVGAFLVGSLPFVYFVCISHAFVF